MYTRVNHSSVSETLTRLDLTREYYLLLLLLSFARADLRHIADMIHSIFFYFNTLSCHLNKNKPV